MFNNKLTPLKIKIDKTFTQVVKHHNILKIITNQKNDGSSEESGEGDSSSEESGKEDSSFHTRSQRYVNTNTKKKTSHIKIKVT